MSDLDSDDISEDEDLEGNLGDEVDMDDEGLDDVLDDDISLAAKRPGENARRRVEEYLEMKRAAKELADLDSYDFE
jgi:hypothetical protein